MGILNDENRIKIGELWQEFDLQTIPFDEVMIFWDSRLDIWFSGTLCDDSEVGICIRDGSNYWTTDDVSHYLLVGEPNKISHRYGDLMKTIVERKHW